MNDEKSAIVVNNFDAKCPKDETTLVCLRTKEPVWLEVGEREGKSYGLNLECWAMARSCKAKRRSFSSQVTHNLVQEADSYTNVYSTLQHDKCSDSNLHRL